MHKKGGIAPLKYLHTTKGVKNIGCPSSERLRQQVFTYQDRGIPDVGWQIEKLGDRKNLEAAGTKIERDRQSGVYAKNGVRSTRWSRIRSIGSPEADLPETG